MRIAGHVLAEETAAPLGGVTVRVARRGAGNALLSLMTNMKGEFESELSDDFLVEPVLVLTATRAGFLEARLERAPGPEMQVALGLRAERPLQPPSPPPLVRPPTPPRPAPVPAQVGWLGRLFRALGAALLLAIFSFAAFWTVELISSNWRFASLMQLLIFAPVCTLFLAWRDWSIRKAVRRELQGEGQ